MGNLRYFVLFAFWLAVATPTSTATSRPAPADDRFLVGVATATLQLRFGLDDVDVVVRDGRLWLDPTQLGGWDGETVKAALDGLHGLEVMLKAAPEPLLASTTVLPGPGSSLDEEQSSLGFLPEQELFETPVADPRSPGFGAGVQWYLDDDEFTQVGRADFGGSLPVYGWRMADGLWQVGIQGGAFSIFDLGRSPPELVNSDFLIALPLEARYGDLSARLRVLHQSSHLGDEFLLRTDTDRMNLSYEAVDLLLAHQIGAGWRVYAGGRSLIRRSPDDFEPLGVQGGIEYLSPAPVLTPITYPLAAVDVQSFEESDWRANVSARAGVELRNGFLAGTRVQLLAEYFNGRSPDGQFFGRSIEYAGIGLRVLF